MKSFEKMADDMSLDIIGAYFNLKGSAGLCFVDSLSNRHRKTPIGTSGE